MSAGSAPLMTARTGAAVRGEKPIAVTPHEDLMVQEALISASGM